MSKVGKVIALIVALVFIGIGVYTFFYTADSQSRVVRTHDPKKAEMLKQLQQGLTAPSGAGGS